MAASHSWSIDYVVKNTGESRGLWLARCLMLWIKIQMSKLIRISCEYSKCIIFWLLCSPTAPLPTCQVWQWLEVDSTPILDPKQYCKILSIVLDIVFLILMFYIVCLNNLKKYCFAYCLGFLSSLIYCFVYCLLFEILWYIVEILFGIFKLIYLLL